MKTKTTGIITDCPKCGDTHTILVEEIDFIKWEQGMLVQEAFPYLNIEEREQLITGICGTCWTNMFGNMKEGD